MQQVTGGAVEGEIKLFFGAKSGVEALGKVVVPRKRKIFQGVFFTFLSEKRRYRGAFVIFIARKVSSFGRWGKSF